ASPGRDCQTRLSLVAVKNPPGSRSLCQAGAVWETVHPNYRPVFPRGQRSFPTVSFLLPPLVPTNFTLDDVAGKSDRNCLRLGKGNDGWRHGHEVVHFLDGERVEINAGHGHS